MSKLYMPGTIGSLAIRNRLVMTAMHLAYCPDGEVSPRMLEYYRLRARGGAGLIVAGAMGIDPVRVNEAGMVQIHDDRFIPGIRQLTDAVHAEGAKIMAQLFHAGRYARAKEYGGRQAVAPSAVASRFTGEMPQALSLAEIDEIVAFFAAAAGRTRLAGFDGVELTGNSGYLIAQFLSPVTNLRTDQYGGDLNRRLTFPREIVTAIRNAVGPEYPIVFRLGGNDFIPGGNDSAVAQAICQALEKAGVNAFDVTGGWHESAVPQTTMDVPPGVFRYLARTIKAAVTVPVIACNRMDCRTAEKIIDSGDADFIGMARAFIADPEFPNKAARGGYNTIRPCVACNQGCLDQVLFGKALSCLVNAEAGREWELMPGLLAPEPLPLSKPQKILVIGAGVAGLEYARIAALRGHQVSVWEAEDVPGGQALAASLPPGRQDFKNLVHYLVQACLSAGVTIDLGKKATEESVSTALAGERFTRVVIATGARGTVSRLKAEGEIPILQARDVLAKKAGTGSKIVIIGGRALGVETALHLAEEGTLDAPALRFLMLHQAESAESLYQMLTKGSKEITVIDMQQGFARDKGPTTRSSLLGRLRKYAVKLMDHASALAVSQQGVLVEDSQGKRWLPADTVIMAGPSEPQNELLAKLQGKLANLTVIGDAAGIGGMQQAIRQAYDAAIIV